MTTAQAKRYSSKQSYWGGYYAGKVACLQLTKNAEFMDGWDGLPYGFDWKEFKAGFKSGWKEGKMIHQHKEQGAIFGLSDILKTDFAMKMYNAVEEAPKCY